jgi:hypothetical protein
MSGVSVKLKTPQTGEYEQPTGLYVFLHTSDTLRKPPSPTMEHALMLKQVHQQRIH